MPLQLEKTSCRRIPFRAALEASEWHDYELRFTNQTNCTECRREFTEDADYGRWYPSEECVFGVEPRRSDEVHPVTTQHGWFCGEECHGEFMAGMESAA